MSLAGLPLTTLLGLGALVASATVLLYVLKLRRRPVPVPFTRLWQHVLAEKQSSSLFSRLRQLLSLLLQLVMVAALVLALGDPRPSGHRQEGRTFVVLLDASASMGATDVEPTRIAVGREKIAELIDGMAAADRMLLVRLGAAPLPLTTLTGDTAVLSAALESVEVRDTGVDVEAGLGLALDALRGQPLPEIVLVSDGAWGRSERGEEALAEGVLAGQPAEPEPLRVGALDEAAARGVRVSYVPVGLSGRNVAITQFAVRRYPLDKSRHEVLIELTNTGSAAEEVELALHGDGVIVDVQRLHVAGGEALRRIYPDLGGASGELMAEVRLADGTGDDLPADDRAYATLPERRRARVLVVTEGNAYLEAALLLDEYLDVTQVRPAAYPPAGDFDVTVFDGVAPTREARTGAALYLGVPDRGADAPLATSDRLEMFGFDVWDEKSPLLRWMVLPDIQVLHGSALVAGAGDRVLGASESARGAKRPILVSGRREQGEFVALGFDPRRSDFVLRVAWPLFLLNVIDHFTEEGGEALSAYRTGAVWRVPLSGRPELGAQGAVRVRQPDGSVVEAPVEQGYAVLFGERAGVYEVEGASPPLRFAANLVDVGESRILPNERLEVSPQGAESAAEVLLAGPVEGLVAGTRQQWWALLLLAVIGLSLLEWVTYHRRWTV